MLSAGSGGLLSPNIAALLSGNTLNRDGSMDWMAWPPPRGFGQNPADTTGTQANTNRQQPPPQVLVTQQREQQEQQGQQGQQGAGSLLQETPSVNHWLLTGPGTQANTLPVASPTAAAAAGVARPLAGYAHGAAAAAAAGYAGDGGGSGTRARPQTSPLLQGQDNLHLHQIQIGGDQLFHETPPVQHRGHFPASLPYGLAPGHFLPPPTAAAAAGMPRHAFPTGPAAQHATASMPMHQPPSYSLGLAVAANLGVGGVLPQGPFDGLPPSYLAAMVGPPVLSLEEARAAARAARALRKQKMQEKRQRKAQLEAGQGQQEVQGRGGRR